MARNRILGFLGVLVVAAWGCGDDAPTSVNPGDAQAIGEYIETLAYDGPGMLNVQDTGNSDVSRERTDTGSTTEGGKVCLTETYDLKQNFGKIAILRPTSGVIYPGALVQANQAMMDGLPEPVTLGRAPMTLSLDLPGMGAAGIIEVVNPANSSVQAAISDALEWWNANAYQDGYVNAANSAYNLTTSYSSEQTAMDVGLNMSWATGDFSGKFSTFTSAEKSVVTASFQQAFYTVTFDNPQSPEDVFAPAVSLAQVEQQMNSAAPPAYVSSVTYGRIIMMRMETTETVTSTDLEAAFNYGVGKLSAGGDLALRYDGILASSSVEVITIGGNAAVASQLVDPSTLQAVITGENAVYSRNNPGVPISYVVRYLKDDSVAKLGYTTEYSTRECNFANQEITVTFSDIDVLKDCEAVGAGEFDWRLQVINASGTIVGQTSGSTKVSTGDKIIPSRKQFTFTVPNAETSFTCRIRATEWDANLIGQPVPDNRMNNIYVQKSHYFRDGSWSSPSNNVLTLGNDSDCQLRVGYGFSFRGK